MKSVFLRLVIGTTLLAGLLLPCSPASGIERDEVLVRAQTFVYHPWHCTTANQTADCSSVYQSAFVPGDYLGLPYDWGGYMTLYTFDMGIHDGFGAGSYSEDGILDCTVGLDCSGFVSKVWDVGHFTTSSMNQISSAVSMDQIEPADAFNVAGYHVILFGGLLDGDWPLFYEAIGYGVIANASSGWANVSGFTPIRHSDITGTAGSSPIGTAVDPIQVGTFPFVHDGNTSSSLSDMFDYYGADTSKRETGPEVVYEVEIPSSGTLDVTVQDGEGVDIDVQVCSALTTWDCIARHDTHLSLEDLECGIWYVIADTWVNASGTEFLGPYTITVDFAPDGETCPGQNTPYNISGNPGDPCQFPGNPNLPMCNPTLGSDTCLYTGSQPTSDSFCTYGCEADTDCSDHFPGGCCLDIQGAGSPDDYFCLSADFCTPVTPVDEDPADVVTAPDLTQVDIPVEEDTTVLPDEQSPDSVETPDGTLMDGQNSDVNSEGLEGDIQTEGSAQDGVQEEFVPGGQTEEPEAASTDDSAGCSHSRHRRGLDGIVLLTSLLLFLGLLRRRILVTPARSGATPMSVITATPHSRTFSGSPRSLRRPLIP